MPKLMCANCDRSLAYDKELDLYLDVYGMLHCNPEDVDAVLHETE